MVTNEQITYYRKKVSRLLSELRNCLFYESGRVSFPTDASIASMLELSPTALSSISRQFSSMSGVTLLKLMQALSKRLKDESFLLLLRDFVDC